MIRFLVRVVVLLVLTGLLTLALHPELLQVAPRPTRPCGGIQSGRCT